MAKVKDIEEVDIAKLKPYERNAKEHPQEQIDMIVKSIEEYGFINPILIDADYNVIAGHGRILASKKLGLTKVPCLYVEGLSDEQRRAYILADNKLFELGDWNEIELKTEVESIDFDFDSFEDLVSEPKEEEEKKEIVCPRCGHKVEVADGND